MNRRVFMCAAGTVACGAALLPADVLPAPREEADQLAHWLLSTGRHSLDADTYAAAVEALRA